MLNRRLQVFFFHPGKSRLSLATSRTEGNWSLEKKRLMFSSISKCLLILRFYLGQPISSSFSSSSCPLAALNSAFPPSLTQGETCALLSKIKRKKKKTSLEKTLGILEDFLSEEVDDAVLLWHKRSRIKLGLDETFKSFWFFFNVYF